MEYIKYMILCLGFGATATLYGLGATDKGLAVAVVTLVFSCVSWLMERK